MIAGLDVLQAVVGLLRDKAINITLIVHLVGCFIEYLKMHGTTNPKNNCFRCVTKLVDENKSHFSVQEGHRQAGTSSLLLIGFFK
jgi:transcriptional regulatory protein LevR